MEGICMSVIIDNRVYRTNSVSINIGYDINKLDLSGAKIQVKFDTKIVGGVGSKFNVRHSDSTYKGLDGYSSPIMESSREGTSHVFTVDITDEILQKSKFLTVTSNGSLGTDKVDVEISNIEIKTLEHVRFKNNLFALKTYQMLKNGGEVLMVSSEQLKPNISETGQRLLEHDTGKVFYYDGTEWREFV